MNSKCSPFQRVVGLSLFTLTLTFLLFIFLHHGATKLPSYIWQSIDAHIDARLAGVAADGGLLDAVSHPRPAVETVPAKLKDQSGNKMVHGHTHQQKFAIDTASITGIDWKRFAYVQYVTDEEFLCNSVMIFESLQRLKSQADRVLMYPLQWEHDLNDPNSDSLTTRLLKKARDEYGCVLKPIGVIDVGGEPTWSKSLTKLLAFNQTEYDRVLMIDSDALVLQHLDELFLAPSAVVGMPRAYWVEAEKRWRCSAMLLIEPSDEEFGRIQRAINGKNNGDFDMELMNHYQDNCLVIPHRPYLLLTGEYKHKANDHQTWLGRSNKEEKWNGKKVLEEMKYVHFSDWPMPKPWHEQPKRLQEKERPKCNGGDCTDQKIWLGFYSDFAKRRKDICDLDLI